LLAEHFRLHQYETNAWSAKTRDYAHNALIVVVDDEDRENEGDLTLAAEKVTPDLKPRPFVWE